MGGRYFIQETTIAALLATFSTRFYPPSGEVSVSWEGSKEAVQPPWVLVRALLAGEKQEGSRAASSYAGRGPVGQGEIVKKPPVSFPTPTGKQPDTAQAEMVIPK